MLTELQKIMQYETVLGPETDENPPRTPSGNLDPSAAEKGYSGPTAAISGPGLGDLHTIDPGNTQDVSCLDIGETSGN